MKTNEFKAWFDGFTEALNGTPNAEQWKRIKEQVAKIDGTPITEKIYLVRYWPLPGRPYDRYLVSGSNVSLELPKAPHAFDWQTPPAFDSVTAMYAAGKSEAASFTALA